DDGAGHCGACDQKRGFEHQPDCDSGSEGQVCDSEDRVSLVKALVRFPELQRDRQRGDTRSEPAQPCAQCECTLFGDSLCGEIEPQMGSLDTCSDASNHAIARSFSVLLGGSRP